MDFVLRHTAQGLALEHLKHSKWLPLCIDFTHPRLEFRRQHANRKTELLIRAMGYQKRERITIIDATAGLGQDSFILASVGYHVIMLERSPILYALLADALHRIAKHPSLGPIAKRLSLIHTDAISYLPSLKEKPDIIYLDPMFPSKQKQAAVKKEMQLLQLLLATEENNTATLFSVALTCAKTRVVVKRPRRGLAITQLTPDFSLPGKSSRFDVYNAKPTVNNNE